MGRHEIAQHVKIKLMAKMCHSQVGEGNRCSHDYPCNDDHVRELVMYAPEHEEQPAQPDQVHFNVHVWTFDEHQLLHNEAVVVPGVVLEHEEHPAQRDQMHFIAHFCAFEAHQLSHGAMTVVVVAVVVLEHGEHAAQCAQVHFVAHGLELGAHQLSHVLAVLIVLAIVVGFVVMTIPAMRGECCSQRRCTIAKHRKF